MTTVSDTQTPQAHLLADMIPALKVSDRCDSCGGQAFYAVLMNQDTGPLMFCGHDSRKHESILTHTAMAIRDERHLIDQPPSPSANV